MNKMTYMDELIFYSEYSVESLKWVKIMILNDFDDIQSWLFGVE